MKAISASASRHHELCATAGVGAGAATYAVCPLMYGMSASCRARLIAVASCRW
jgi:hypothetical protein